MWGNAIVEVEQGLAVPGATIAGTSGDDTISLNITVAGQPFATRRNDVIDGNDGNDSLNGRRGADTLTGGTGDDLYFVDDAADQVIETAEEGTDRVRASVSYTLEAGQEIEVLRAVSPAGLTLTGNEVDNELVGGTGDDTLNGGTGADTLKGEAGGDQLHGGAGDDRLIGGGGSDIFVLEAPSDGVDRIADFEQGVDLIGILASGFGGGLVTGATPVVVNAASAASASMTGPDGYFIFDNAGPGMGHLYWDATGGDGTDAVAVAVLSGIVALDASDFLVA